MVIGVRKPFLLLPESVRHAGNPDFNEHQLMAILTHELAHIRRRDYLVNLLAGIGSLPIAWHPATIVIQARIRQTREMICDAAAAGCFGTSSTYARALLSLAESLIQPQPNVQALGFFDANRKTLEERIMKLTQTQPTSTLPVRIARIATGAVILIAATTAAATLHLRPSAPAVYAAQQTNAPAAAPPVTDESVPPAEAIVIQAPTPAPAAKPAHAPVSEPAPQATIREENRKITPEERNQLDDTLATVREQVRAATAQIDTAKLKQEIGAAKLESVNSPEFKKQMEDMRESMKAFHLQQQFAALSPELKQQMEELKLRLTSPEFREQMKLNIPLVVMPNISAMQSGNLVGRVPDPAFKKRIADAREQMRAEIKQANGDTEQIQKAVDQFVSEVDRATKELVREKTITLPPVPPTPPRPLQ